MFLAFHNIKFSNRCASPPAQGDNSGCMGGGDSDPEVRVHFNLTGRAKIFGEIFNRREEHS